MSHTFEQRRRQKVVSLIDMHHRTYGLNIKNEGDDEHSIAKYYGYYMVPETADKLHSELINHYNKDLFVTKSDSCMSECGFSMIDFGNEGLVYAFSQETAIAWKHSPVLTQLKEELEEKFSTIFNHALIYRYEDEESYIPWHSDNKNIMAKDSWVAGITLGESCAFQFRSRAGHGGKLLYPDQIRTINRAHGALLLMNRDFQGNYAYGLPRQKGTKEPRFNITFRKMILKK